MKESGISSIAHEELLSSLDIQEWNLKTFACEIYENIGQILSLAKFRIASLNPEKKEEVNQIAEQSDQLLNRAIKDLRRLAKQLTPTEILQKGFLISLSYEMERLNNSGLCKTTLLIKGHTFRLQDIKELLLFSILQHYILKALYIENTRMINVIVSFKQDMISISIYFPVNTELNSRIKMKNGFGVLRRARLIGAVVKLNRKNHQKDISIWIKK